jgi:hypothetical protein
MYQLPPVYMPKFLGLNRADLEQQAAANMWASYMERNCVLIKGRTANLWPDDGINQTNLGKASDPVREMGPWSTESCDRERNEGGGSEKGELTGAGLRCAVAAVRGTESLRKGRSARLSSFIFS